ncbi:unnamed protein product [Parnassius apollo]|uniref:(apollo) hypothetical protein n=1 Tax=Parnassius apollo TaxID=110799 RepID=A0A8S3W4W8_PARAO|nr:unnamed protein product [Parnassius apollo]
MKEVDPSADISKVQKKINNLRTVFRKELKKVESSRASGSGTDNIYVPKLWYYEKLFLKDQEQPYGATSSSIDSQSDDDSIESTRDEVASPTSDIVSVERFSEPQ